MKKTIIGYIPTVIVFGVPASVFLLGVLYGVLRNSDYCLLHRSDYYEELNPLVFGADGFYLSMFIFFPIGGILNLAFLADACFSTSEGSVSKGELMTAIITLVIQIYIIHYIIPLIHLPLCKLA